MVSDLSRRRSGEVRNSAFPRRDRMVCSVVDLTSFGWSRTEAAWHGAGERGEFGFDGVAQKERACCYVR